MVQPKPAASSISWCTCEPSTNSFFGTQPRITQVPPIRYSSATMTLAPWLAAMRAARTPPEPPPMTKRSTSYSAIRPQSFPRTSVLIASEPKFQISLFDAFSSREPVPTSLENAPARSDRLVALLHLFLEALVHHARKHDRPLVHVGHAELDGARLGREQLL